MAAPVIPTRFTERYYRWRDRVRNNARAWKSRPVVDFFVCFHLAWLSFAAALVRSWESLGIALGILALSHAVFSFFESVSPRT